MTPLHLATLADSAALPWRNGGGTTHELLTWPPGEADWQLRVSVATIARDGPFSRFDGVQRWFTVLSGAGVRLQLPRGGVSLAPGDPPLTFDGADAPGCTLVAGPTRDLNLMAQHRSGRASMAQAVAGHPLTGPHRWRGLYTAAPVLLQTAAGHHRLAAHTLTWRDAGCTDTNANTEAEVDADADADTNGSDETGLPTVTGAWTLIEPTGPAWWLTLEA